MKNIAIVLLFLSFPFLAAESGNKTFGADPKLKGEPLALSKAMESGRMNQMIKIRGRAITVCQKKGCWMELADEKMTARVTFKDYGFFVPKDILNKTVIVEGILTARTIPKDEARHYAEDAGKAREEIEKITSDQKEYSIVAESVLVP